MYLWSVLSAGRSSIPQWKMQGLVGVVGLGEGGVIGLGEGGAEERRFGSSEANVLPRQEVISRLRDRSEPISLFGESELDAFRTLRRCEILEPEISKGFKNDFQKAMEQVDQEYLDELISRAGSNKSKVASENKSQEEELKSYDEIKEMTVKMRKGYRDYDMTVIMKVSFEKCGNINCKLGPHKRNGEPRENGATCTKNDL
ncbi:PREDICTED: pre-mRNA-splicing factor 18-like [Nicrophorus vespilloides]|uniref:Pre-mRNA-splicing factor 18-like n=1 Tax=Nicrophorus vespilloides TaxID=110193 RepID=A0ABM1M5U1_NICVS|nr:PREDICTED: pre-mRNA-splicing factor 18-like [Nicrophorus vespilloides]